MLRGRIEYKAVSERGIALWTVDGSIVRRVGLLISRRAACSRCSYTSPYEQDSALLFVVYSIHGIPQGIIAVPDAAADGSRLSHQDLRRS
jgi:hypothetical protein